MLSSLLFTSQACSLLEDISTGCFLVQHYFCHCCFFPPTKSLIHFQTFWLSFSDRLSLLQSLAQLAFSFTLSPFINHSFFPFIVIHSINLFNKYLLTTYHLPGTAFPIETHWSLNPPRYPLLSVLTSVCEHCWVCLHTDRRRPRPAVDLAVAGPLWTGDWNRSSGLLGLCVRWCSLPMGSLSTGTKLARKH